MSSIGEIHFTGFEDNGVCWYCGNELPQRRRKWCSDKCRDIYWQTWNWHFASLACRKRAKNCCENCHKREGISSLEIHHIIPLNGQDRNWNKLNEPDNLLCLCHDCHMQVHRATQKENKNLTKYALEIEKGQLVLL